MPVTRPFPRYPNDTELPGFFIAEHKFPGACAAAVAATSRGEESEILQLGHSSGSFRSAGVCTEGKRGCAAVPPPRMSSGFSLVGVRVSRTEDFLQP